MWRRGGWGLLISLIDEEGEQSEEVVKEELAEEGDEL